MPTERYYLTQAGLVRAKERLANARAAYQAVCDDNPAARESGDSSVWHDNFAFEENQRQMHQLARRVRDLEQIVAGAVLVEPLKLAPATVVVGARVTLRVSGEPGPRVCTIAGWDDGDPSTGRISYNSPLGCAVLGAELGDVVEATLAGRAREIEIVEIGLATEPDGAPCRVF